MKKWSILIAAALLFSFLTGCRGGGSAPEGSGEEGPAAYAYSYDPHALPAAVEEALGEALPAYRAAVDAVESGEEEVAVGDEASYEKIFSVLREYYPPYDTLEGHVYREGKAELAYRYNKNAHLQALSGYRNTLSRIMNLALREGDSDTAKTLGVYLYVTSAFYESDGRERSVWETLQSNAVHHNGYAAVGAALLLQAGVDCIQVETKRGDDGTPHRLILVRLGSSFYYLDPFGETLQSDGEGLASFGMTRADCLANGYRDAFEPIGCESLPAADDSRFSVFRLCGKWSFSEDRTQITIATDAGENPFGPLE